MKLGKPKNEILEEENYGIYTISSRMNLGVFIISPLYEFQLSSKHNFNKESLFGESVGIVSRRIRQKLIRYYNEIR